MAIVNQTVGGVVKGGAQAFRAVGGLVGHVPIIGHIGQEMFDVAGDLVDPITKFSAQRIKDFDFGSGEPTWPLPFGIGPNCRTPCRVIWASPVKAVKISDDGKGGGSATAASQYDYFVSLAVLIAEAPDGGIAELTSLWADTKFLWGQDPSKNVTSNLLSAEKSTGGGKTFLTITSPLGGPNLKKFKVGVDVTMSGWTVAGNNITARVVKKWNDKDTGETFLKVRDDGDPPTVADDPADTTVTLFQDNFQFNANDAATVTVHLGDDTQVADPAIEGFEGTGNVPAWRGLAYVVISDLRINKYGARIPQFTARYKAHASLTVDEAVDAVLARTERPSSEWDVSGLSGDVLGYVMPAGNSAGDNLAPLLVAYDVLSSETDGVVTFFHREDAPHVTLDPNRLSASPFGQDGQQDLGLERAAGLRLPSEVSLTYLDPANDCQTRDAPARRARFDTRVSVAASIPLVMLAEDAIKVAKRLLWYPLATRQAPDLQLPLSVGLTLQESDVLHATVYGNPWSIQAQQIDESVVSGVVTVAGLSDDSGVLDLPDVGMNDGEGDDPNVFPELFLAMLDIPAIAEAELTVPGIYWAPAIYDPAEFWPGGVLFDSGDGATFSVADTASVEATVGFCLTTLGDGTVTSWDYANTLRVRVFNGQLESRSEEDVLNGANAAAVVMADGAVEIIGFQVATLVASNVDGSFDYDLSTLLRGVRDTDQTTADHGADEVFILLTSVKYLPLTLDILDKDRTYKVVPIGGVEANYIDTEDVTHTLRTLRPFSPITKEVIEPGGDGEAGLTGYGSGSGDIELQWYARTRAFIDPFISVGAGVAGLFIEGQQPVLEEVNEFIVDVYSSGVFITSYTVVGTGGDFESWTYDAADQVTDLGPLVVDLGFKISQRSTSVGRGTPREIGAL